MIGLQFSDGAIQFRQRLAVSLLSHKPLLIRNIRPDSIFAPGLRPYEVSFLRLLEKMTNGTVVEINSTGTQLRFYPGILIGGNLEHDCPFGTFESLNNGEDHKSESKKLETSEKCVGWYLEGILPISPFGKRSLTLTLNGITNGSIHTGLSPDYISSSMIPLMSRFGIGSLFSSERNLLCDDFPPPNIKIVSRGFYPSGGGIVKFFCPAVKELICINFSDPGLIKRVRGTVSTCCLPPFFAAQTAHNAKGLMLRLLPDVWIYTDVQSNRKSTRSKDVNNINWDLIPKWKKKIPCINIIMTSLSTTGAILSAETNHLDFNLKNETNKPENIGLMGAAMLLEEVDKGGCVDSHAQSLALLFMCLTPQDVSIIRIGTLSQYSITSLRLFKKCFGVEFKVSIDDERKMVRLSCMGIGYQNMARTAT